MFPEQPEQPNQKRLVIAGAIVFVLLIGGVFFVSKKDKGTSSPQQQEQAAGGTGGQTGSGQRAGQAAGGQQPGQMGGSQQDGQTVAGTVDPVAGSPIAGSSVDSQTQAQAHVDGAQPGSTSNSSAAGAVQGTGGALSGAFARFMGIFGGVSKKASQTEATSDPGRGAMGSAERGIASSTLSDSASSSTSPLVKAPAPGPELRDGCVTVSFIHKKAQGHTSDEVCTHHKNLIRIKHPNPSSVCIRVNKTPVKYEAVKGKTNEFIIGALAGPKAEISATYCVGSAICKEKCVVPKDDFMAAIGGSDQDGKNPQVAQWDAEDRGGKETDVYGNLDADTKRELDRLEQGDQAEETARLFQDWIRGAELPACGTQQAALGGSKE